MTAVIVRSLGEPELTELALRPLGPTDVLVSIEAAGICHSDISAMNGTLSGTLPVVLGHEGAGKIVEVGSSVSRLRVGDRVVLSATPVCGTCWFCARGESNLCERGRLLRTPPFFDGTTPVRGVSGLGTFADALVVDELAAIPVSTDLPSDLLALVGCAVVTGAGCALNIATVRAGTSVLVVGAGGVGLSAIQGARAQGALPIVAVDPSPVARELAVACGATHAFAPGDELADQLMPITAGRGFDVVIDSVGSSGAFLSSYQATRRGGELVMVGVGKADEVFPIPLVDVVLSGKKLLGCVYGGTSVHRDVARYVAMAELGRFDLGALVGRHIGLHDVVGALTDPSPPAGRTVIVMT